MKQTKTAFIKATVKGGIVRINRITHNISLNLEKEIMRSRIDAEKLVLESLAEQIYYLEVRVEDLMKDLKEVQE